jgi:hypothetical protein
VTLAADQATALGLGHQLTMAPMGHVEEEMRVHGATVTI